MERISIITVCLNAVAHIEAAIKSVGAQTYPLIEHVIIDGGSSDGTQDIVNKYRDQIDYFVSESDTGIYHAMNKGIKATNGDVLFFLNSDDFFCDEKVIEDIASIFNQEPDLDIIYGNLLWNWQGKLIRRQQPPVITREFLAGATILHQTIFARKHVFDATKGFSEHYKVVSDYEWMLKVFLRDQRQYRYYDRDIAVMDTRGRSWSTNWEKERIDVMRKYFNLYEILKYRVIPMKKKSISKTIDKFRKK